jgi:subtilisin family serine protease
MKHIILTCLGVLLLAIPAKTDSTYALKIHPQLAEKIASSPDAYFQAFLMMVDESRATSLTKSLGLDRYSRQAGHAVAIRHLKERARVVQHDVIEFLQSQIKTGRVRQLKSHWIDNVVSIVATGSLIREISGRDDVAMVYEIETVQLIRPIENSTAASSPSDTVYSALRVIGADSMWALGYTGAGRLVCGIDTGVDGGHPALSGTWRGYNGYSWQESWFDPVDGDSVPHVLSTSTNPEHGTHTLGIMVGHDDATGDTVGVAPEANWIAAAVVDVGGGNILDAFEWAADPDGDPNTVMDVPDAICNSWGYPQIYLGCEDVFWNSIDNVEALGCVVIFACGNEGNQGPQTIRNPANRATTPYNSFAVGMIDPEDPSFPVHSRSSQGPSDCDGVSLKPQVCAPGVAIRSTVPIYAGSYAELTGTSMAAPHVAGAVALLRQYNPNAPVDSIKKALMETAIDIEDPGPDMKSGYGLIYIPAALEALVPNNEPNIVVENINKPVATPGDTFAIEITLLNTGLGLTDVAAKLRSYTPLAEVIDSFYFFGNLPLDGESSNTSTPFTVEVSDTAGPTALLDLTLEVTGSGSYSKDIPLEFEVPANPPIYRSRDVHDVGNVLFGVSNYGQYGFADSSIAPEGLPGFVWPNDGSGSNNLFEMALLIATDSSHVSDAARNRIRVPDDDFEVAVGGNLRMLSLTPDADQESRAIFNDSRAEDPIGVNVQQFTYAYQASTDDDFIILAYLISNNSGSPLDDIYIGISGDWDWPWGIPYYSGDNDRVGFIGENNLGYMYSADSIDNPDYRGITVLSSMGSTSFKAINSETYVWDNDGLTEAEKWAFMTGGIDTSTVYTYPADHSCIMTTGPYTIGLTDTIEVAFAVMGAGNLDDLIMSSVQAQTTFDGLVVNADDVGDPIQPESFALWQNYPNPFNATTTIEFYLDRTQHVKLSIYDLLGRVVEVLADKEFVLGKHALTWVADGYASGLYFYRLETDSGNRIRKMVLLK